MTEANPARLEWASRNGFGSIEWMRFDTSPAAHPTENWRHYSEEFSAKAKSLNINISAIGALYKNPLDQTQSEHARAVFLRAIEVASLIGVKTVCGFAGAVIELETHPKGGNLVYKPFEQFLPRLIQFWEPILKIAADSGVRIAFENCPMAPYHLPIMGFNMLAQPALWERLFNEIPFENVGIEWDPSHLVCQFIDPIANLRKFGPRIFHVHAKDASINRHLLADYGICHPGVAEHRMPGFGDSNWAQIISELFRAGYDSDLNIEGWHDPVFRDHDTAPPSDITLPGGDRQAGQKLEQAGLLLAKRELERHLPP